MSSGLQASLRGNTKLQRNLQLCGSRSDPLHPWTLKLVTHLLRVGRQPGGQAAQVVRRQQPHQEGRLRAPLRQRRNLRRPAHKGRQLLTKCR